MLLPRRQLVFGVHAADLHVAPRRDRGDPVLGLASFDRDELRSEEEEKLLDPHPCRLCGEEVSGLVEDDQQREAEEDQHPVHTFANPPTASSVRARASASTSKRSSKWVGCTAGIAASTRSIASGMAANPILPSRKAATATSSAALSTQGAVPPARPASSARRRQENVSRSGGSKSSWPTDARSSRGTSTSARSG